MAILILASAILRRDIARRVKAEKALSSSEQRYRLLFQNNLAAVFVTSIDGHIHDCNEAFVQLAGGSSPKEVIGRSVADYYVRAGDREALVEVLRKEGRVTGREMCFRRLDGSRQSELLEAILIALGGQSAEASKPPLITRHALRERRPVLSVLVAEDHLVNQRLAVRLLEKRGHRVEIAVNGLQALAGSGEAKL